MLQGWRMAPRLRFPSWKAYSLQQPAVRRCTLLQYLGMNSLHGNVIVISTDSVWFISNRYIAWKVRDWNSEFTVPCNKAGYLLGSRIVATREKPPVTEVLAYILYCKEDCILVCTCNSDKKGIYII